MRFLFWNLNRKPLGDLVAALAEEHDPDVLVLAESHDSPIAWLLRLDASNRRGFRFLRTGCDRVQVFFRFGRHILTPVAGEPRYSIARLCPPASPERLIVFAHLPSKLHSDPDSQTEAARELSWRIQLAEIHARHDRTLVVGDLNMNPFEPGVAKAGALHAVNCRQVAEGRVRSIRGREHKFFYNPMWSFLGTRSGRDVGGSYFYKGSKDLEYYWNVFDQVLIRPSLLPSFDERSLRILSSVRKTPLVTKEGFPDARTASDHLPIIFDLH